jgi:hypothetical protein
MGARLLLVHSPLVGPATWDLVARYLAERGYEVTVPDLTATVAEPPPYLPRQAAVIAGSASGQPSILIGHSGAGLLLAAAGALTGRARGYLFADAGLPIPGRTWMETVPPELASQVREMADARGWLPPWPRWWGEEVLAELIPDPDQRRGFAAGCPPLPLAMFEEAHPAVPDWPDAPGGYLQLSDAYHGQADMARDLGWPVITRDSHHLAPLTDPGMVAESLHALIGRLRV